MSSLRSGRGQSDRRHDGPRAFSVYVARVVLEALEERLPLGIDRLGVGLVAGVQIVDVRGVGAVEERSESESGVRILARHVRIPSFEKSGNGGEPYKRIPWKATNQPGPARGDFSCTLFNGSMRQGKDLRSES